MCFEMKRIYHYHKVKEKTFYISRQAGSSQVCYELAMSQPAYNNEFGNLIAFFHKTRNNSVGMEALIDGFVQLYYCIMV